MKSELVGIIVLVPKTDEQIEIMNLSINEKWQGKGFAKTLIEYACLYSDNKGYRTVTIGTGNSSLNQLALYQKAGFRITGIDYDYFIAKCEKLLENADPESLDRYNLWCMKHDFTSMKNGVFVLN